MEPGTQIHINIPQAGSDDQIEIDAREVFEGFPAGLQRALESGGLDRVSEVLGKMSVEEAEEVVAKLGDAGTLFCYSRFMFPTAFHTLFFTLPYLAIQLCVRECIWGRDANAKNLF